MLHLGLVQEHQDELLAARLVVDDQSFVLDIRAEASAVDFHRRLYAHKEEEEIRRLIAVKGRHSHMKRWIPGEEEETTQQGAAGTPPGGYPFLTADVNLLLIT